MLKKLIISLSLCITSFAFFSVFAEENSDTFMTLFEYNNKYGKNETEDDPGELLSLDEYNSIYGNEEVLLTLDEYNSTYSNEEGILNNPQNLYSSSAWTISPVKQQTKPVIVESGACQVGTITLQYQTDIQGGRPLLESAKKGHSESSEKGHFQSIDLGH